jgi:simple sugar transport system substrate-binding protein
MGVKKTSLLLRRRTMAALPMLAAMSSAPVSRALAAPSRNQNWSNIHMLFLIWSFESNSFFAPMVNGVRDAEKDQGIIVDIKYGNEDLTRMNDIIQTAIAGGTNGVATTIPNDTGLNAVLEGAQKKGLPVVAFNIDNSKGAAGGSYRLAYIGQNFVTAGYTIGNYMIANFHLGKGDLVFTPVEAPAAVYAVQRHAGVAKALAEVGARTEILGTGNDHARALSLMTQYLIGHSDTKAIIGLGEAPTSQAVAAIKEAGLRIPAAGFDVDPQIVRNIEAGTLAATVDQQPYIQGYYTVTEMALLLKYGITPSDIDTGGRSLITKANAGLAAKWAGAAR